MELSKIHHICLKSMSLTIDKKSRHSYSEFSRVIETESGYSRLKSVVTIPWAPKNKIISGCHFQIFFENAKETQADASTEESWHIL